MATRSRYRSFTAKEKLKKQKILKAVQQEESMMWAKVVFVTGAKNKTRLTERNSNRLAFCGQKARHPELEKGYAITWTIKNNTDAHHGFQSYTASVSSSGRRAGSDLASSGDRRGNGQPLIAPARCTGLYLRETHCSYNIRADWYISSSNFIF